MAPLLKPNLKKSKKQKNVLNEKALIPGQKNNCSEPMTKSSESSTAEEYLKLKSLEHQLYHKVVAFRHRCPLMFKLDVEKYVETTKAVERLRINLEEPKTVGNYFENIKD